MENVSFDVTSEECKILHKIAKRGAKLLGVDLLSLDMDVTATHANGCPLDLEKLLAFDDANFGHDVGGISRFINRNTGKLTNCFDPRCSK